MKALQRRALFAAPVLLGLGLAVSGCLGLDTSASAVAPVSAAAVPAVDPNALVGKWGLASFHKDEDKVRTEAAARAQCNRPFVIGKGENGGVMMHVADQKEAQEVFVKSSPDGRTFIGPTGPPGVQGDLEMISFDKGVLVASWVDPDTASRYGTMVYARCKTI